MYYHDTETGTSIMQKIVVPFLRRINQAICSGSCRLMDILQHKKMIQHLLCQLIKEIS